MILPYVDNNLYGSRQNRQNFDIPFIVHHFSLSISILLKNIIFSLCLKQFLKMLTSLLISYCLSNMHFYGNFVLYINQSFGAARFLAAPAPAPTLQK